LSSTTLAPTPRVSIVIPVYNQVDFTLLCLQAIEESQRHNSTPFEVVVVDNASTDDTPLLLHSLSGDVRTLRNERNLGFGDACNQGAAQSRTEYVLFLNNDTAVCGDWLDVLVAAMDEDPRRGAAQPKLLYPDGSLNDAGGLVFRDGRAAVYGKGSPHPDAPAFNVRRAPDYASGACLVVRREAFEEVGGFDSRYAPAYYEDTDLSFALRSKGWTLLYEPAAVVIHVEGGTAGLDETSGFKAHQPLNRLKFAKKWNTELRTRPALDLDLLEGWAHRPQGGQGPGESSSASADGRRVLVLDPFPPMYDRAGGCARTLEMEKSLRALGHSVVHEATAGAPERARYARHMSRWGIRLHGDDPAEPSALVDGGTVNRPRYADDAFDHVIVGPWENAEILIPVIRQHFPRASISVDTCDLHFLREERAAAHAPDVLADRRARELATYAAADSVIAVSEAEAEILTELLPSARVLVIGTAHDVPASAPAFEDRDGVCFIGNTNHPPNEEAARWLVSTVWPLVLESVPGARLKLVGNDPRGVYDTLTGEGVDAVGWVESTAAVLDSCRVSVAPLVSGAGIKIKIAEAMARGVPVVTTGIGAEGLCLDGSGAVLVGETAAELAAHTIRLLRDGAHWERTSEAAVQHAGEHFSEERMRAALSSLLDTAAPRSTSPDEPQGMTLVVNTKNESSNIGACIASCAGVDRIVVVDMQSDDDTRQTALAAGAEVHTVPDVGFVEPARKFALSTVTSGWVLLLDADERMAPGGIEKLRALLPRVPSSIDALLVTGFVLMGDRHILGTGWEPQHEQHIRVFRAGSVTWPDHLHAVPAVRGATAALDPSTGIYLDHVNWRDYGHFLEKTVRYTAIEAARPDRARTKLSDDVAEAVAEFERRYAPEVDGETSFALSFGMLCYKLFTSMQVSERHGFSRTAPDRAELMTALHAAVAACRSAELVAATPPSAEPS